MGGMQLNFILNKTNGSIDGGISAAGNHHVTI
jgi:hypothetical protein